jgi:hypothetical protein
VEDEQFRDDRDDGTRALGIGDATAGEVSRRGRATLAQIKDSKRVRGPFAYDQWVAERMTDASPVQNLVRIRLEVVQVLEQVVLVLASNR